MLWCSMADWSQIHNKEADSEWGHPQSPRKGQGLQARGCKLSWSVIPLGFVKKNTCIPLGFVKKTSFFLSVLSKSCIFAPQKSIFHFCPKSCFKLLLFQEKGLNKVKLRIRGVTKSHLLTLYNKTTSQLRKKCCLLLTSKKLYHETQRLPQIEKHRPAGVLHVFLPPRLLPTFRLGEVLFGL